MSFIFHELQDIFFERLKYFLLTEDFTIDSMNAIDLKDLKINNWRILFPEGLEQMALSFDKWQSKKTMDEMVVLSEKLENPQSKTQKISIALEIKIMKILPKNVFLKQQAFFALFKNHFIALESASYFCDILWRSLDDQSLDFSFYTKRISLFFIYVVIVFFYCGDRSENYIDTKEFIKDSLNNFSSLAILKEKIKTKINIQDIPILRYIF
ncbi:MAG: COQ9 family protein [Rickettsia sp.]|nr:COQ9 family protein [Rickettsia sp.]